MITNIRPKLRRNETCRFCASGLKFKKCHGAPQAAASMGGYRCAGHPQEKSTLFAVTPVTALGPVPAKSTDHERPHKDWFIGLRHPSARNARRLERHARLPR